MWTKLKILVQQGSLLILFSSKGVNKGVQHGEVIKENKV